VLSQEQKNRIIEKLPTQLTLRGDIVVTAEAERSQPQNRAEAITKLESMVTAALKVPKKRKATKPTYASKLRRTEGKRLHGAKKKARTSIFE